MGTEKGEGMEIVLADGSSFDAGRLKTEKWLSYLYYTEHHGINMERVEVVEQVSGRETLSYVLRTLEILEEDYGTRRVSPEENALIKTVLQWSEVSPGFPLLDGPALRNLRPLQHRPDQFILL